MAAHVLVIPYPIQGHISPLIKLSEKLASRGVLVTFVNTEYSHDRLMKARKHEGEISLGQDFFCNFRFAQISDGLPADFNREANGDVYFNALLNMGGALEDLLRNQRVKSGEPPICCIISSLSLVSPFQVAKNLQLPWVAFWSQSVSAYAIYNQLSHIKKKGHFPPHKEDPRDTIDYIPGLPPLQPEDLPSDIQSGDPTALLHQLVILQTDLFQKADWIIGNTVYELESQAIDAVQQTSPIYSLGPLHPLIESNHRSTSPSLSLWAESNCLPWLDSKPRSSVLYVSFGSLVQTSKAQVEELAMGLMHSGHSFLWVLRPFRKSPHATLDEILPKDFIEKTKSRGLVVTWCPQVSVLAHPSIGGFFTHGGWNSAMEGLSSGVPMLVFPQFFDQYTNSMLIAKQWKIGIRVETCREDGVVEGRDIASAVKALLEGEQGQEMKRRSRQVKETVTKSVFEGGSSWKNMETFVAYLLSVSKH